MKVSVIVPAYNEQKNVRNVLHCIRSSGHVNEVVFVNDGSTDNTLKEARKVKGITVVSYAKNHGKGYAVAKGIRKASGDIIVTLDSDLQCDEESMHAAIGDLVTPIKKNTHDMVVAYVDGYKADVFFRPIGGQRAFRRKDLMELIDTIEQKGYGLELFLNYSYKDRKIKIFPLKGVKHQIMKGQEYSTVVKLTVREIRDMLAEVLKQDKPSNFFLRSYIFSFYMKDPKEYNKDIQKLVSDVKKRVIDLVAVNE